jgi:hypothetical protein
MDCSRVVRMRASARAWARSVIDLLPLYNDAGESCPTLLARPAGAVAHPGVSDHGTIAVLAVFDCAGGGAASCVAPAVVDLRKAFNSSPLVWRWASAGAATAAVLDAACWRQEAVWACTVAHGRRERHLGEAATDRHWYADSYRQAWRRCRLPTLRGSSARSPPS